jgi:two-component system cell cycle response regulator
LRSEERFLSIPILFFTASINMDNKLLGLQLGASDFLGKSCDERELLLRIRNLMRYKKQYDEMVKLSVIDSLTHVYNRRYFQHRLMDEFERARRYDREFCCMIIDVDHFKNINDSHGHPVGDDVLKHVAAILRRNTRAADVLCRYGGDEFGLLLPETNFPGAFVSAERVRTIVEKTDFTKTDSPVKVTLSFGISSLIEGGAMGMDELVTQADVALYQAKRNGRNQICFYGRK